jgi:hypothetical protein
MEKEIQGTAQWHAKRLKRFTGSEGVRLVAEAKREMTEDELKAWKLANPKSTAKLCVDPHLLAEGAMTYVLEVASERLTGKPAKIEFENDAIRWGKEHEPIAKQLYSAVYDVEIIDIDFVEVKDMPYAGASPDGLIGDDVGMEIKCPQSQTVHLKYRTLQNYVDLKENCPNHYWQMVFGMLATGRKGWKFVSYHPHFEPAKQLKVITVPRVEEDIELLKIKLRAAEKACQFLLTV